MHVNSSLEMKEINNAARRFNFCLILLTSHNLPIN